MVASAVGNSYRLSRRELSRCWSLSPLLVQQICVSTARGGIVVDSKGSEGVDGEGGGIRRRVVVIEFLYL
jgi:hypothetical protein